MMLTRWYNSFSPLSLSPTAWYDPSDRSTLFQDTAGTSPVTATGQSVARMNDKSGNGFHVIQATAANCPTYQVDGSGNAYLLFDGSNDFLNVAGVIAQPYEVVSAIQQVAWANGHFIFGFLTSEGLKQASVTPQLTLGSSTLLDGDLAVGANGVVTQHWQGASSTLQVNNSATNSGGSGTSSATTNFTIGSTISGTLAANMRLYQHIIRAGTLSANDLARLKTFVGAKCGVVI